jgi:hypothetical protein
MTDWMAYVYQQKPLPSNFKGVEITLAVIDANGNFRNIGTTTSDATGYYSFNYTPDIEGKYTVVATFQGTNGYWPSNAVASFAIDAASSTSHPTTGGGGGSTLVDQYFIPAVIAIIVVIIIVGAAIMLMLRRR